MILTVLKNGENGGGCGPTTFSLWLVVTVIRILCFFLGNELIACLIFLVIPFRLNNATESSVANLGLIVRGRVNVDVGIC